MLKNSARNSTLYRSFTTVSFIRLKSMLLIPGPQHTERGESPIVPYSAGVSCWKSPVLKARFPGPRGFSRCIADT